MQINLVVFILYMVDLYVMSFNKFLITMLICKVMQKFAMTNLGLITKYLVV
jgi:hypothetical protein